MELTSPATANELQVLVRHSRDSDVEAMLTIYRHHIRRGIEDSVDDSGTPEPDISGGSVEPAARERCTITVSAQRPYR